MARRPSPSAPAAPVAPPEPEVEPENPEASDADAADAAFADEVMGLKTTMQLTFGYEEYEAIVIGTVLAFESGAGAIAQLWMADEDEPPLLAALSAFLLQPENARVLSRRDGNIVLTLLDPSNRVFEVSELHGEYLMSVVIVAVEEASPEETAELLASYEGADEPSE